MQAGNDADQLLIYAQLCEAAELVVSEGITHARADDPHRFATIHREFDAGKANRTLAIEYLDDGRMRVAFTLSGTKDGNPFAVDLFSTTVQGPNREASN